MKFSIIIPAYNAEATMRSCIDSALRQSDAEVILVDDCSQDRTFDIADGYISLRLGRTAVNSGPGAARNIGLEMARGDWIIFLDADDALMPDALKRLYKFISTQPADVDLIGFNWISCDAADGCRRDGHWLDGSRQDLLNAYAALRMDGAVTYTTIRRSSLGKLRFRHGYHEDVDFLYLAYAKAVRTVYFDNVVYIKNASGLTSRITEKHLNGFIAAWKQVVSMHGRGSTPSEASSARWRRECVRSFNERTQRTWKG